jgi:hypothetical protein
MTSATDTDIQQIKDLITVGSAAAQKQIAELAINTQKQTADLAISNQKQIADLDKKIDVGFIEMKGELKNRHPTKELGIQFPENTRSG